MEVVTHLGRNDKMSPFSNRSTTSDHAGSLRYYTPPSIHALKHNGQQRFALHYSLGTLSCGSCLLTCLFLASYCRYLRDPRREKDNEHHHCHHNPHLLLFNPQEQVQCQIAPISRDRQLASKNAGSPCASLPCCSADDTLPFRTGDR